jgi:hypothetical protein
MSGTPAGKERSPQTLLYARRRPFCERNSQISRATIRKTDAGDQLLAAAAAFFFDSFASRDFVRAAVFL